MVVWVVQVVVISVKLMGVAVRNNLAVEHAAAKERESETVSCSILAWIVC